MFLGGCVDDRSASSSILQPHCVHLCVLSATPVWVLLDLSIMKMLFFSVSLFSNPQPPFVPLFPPFLTAALHVTTVSRWAASCTPNAKSGSSFFSLLSVDFFLFFFSVRSQNISVANVIVSQYFNQFPCLVIPQPPGGIPGSQPLLPNSLDPTRPQGKDGNVVIVEILRRGSILWNVFILYSRCGLW